MVWVLVVVAYLGGGYINGYSATTFQEFSTKQSCEAAAVGIRDYASGAFSRYIHAFCTPK